MKLSIVIPAYNEEGSIEETIRTLYTKLEEEQINHEIIVVNDNSKDNTLNLLTKIKESIPTLVVYTNEGPNGFGYAIRYGLNYFQGDCVAILMADLSDNPNDLVRFYRRLLIGDIDCVFAYVSSQGSIENIFNVGCWISCYT